MPTRRPRLTASVPKVLFSRPAASSLMWTVVPVRMALSPSSWRGLREPPCSSNRNALLTATLPLTRTSP
ncbi:hypothetical protein ASF75_06420 [Curtobacterium sp. Leaf154]|nr:hypothetical protein ASF75_06420 [Curtobacterium sp. Leaf154]